MDALRHLEARAYSFTAVTPPSIHREVMRRLSASHLGPDETIQVPNELYMVIVER